MVPAFARELGVNNLRLPILPAGTPPHLPGASIKEEILTITQFTAGQWLTDFYPQGKTSVDSRFNLPGKWAWAGMECVGFITVLYCMFTIPDQLGLDSLPWGNWTMAGVYTIHYVYRALIFPWAQPTMSPIHISVFLAATAWNIVNGLSIGGWVAGYGPQTAADWGGRLYNIEIGLVVWGWGLLANMFHDDDLREIRRSTMRRRKEQAAKDGKPVESVDKLYMLPKNGLFHYVLYAHYFCEWIEWTGFFIIGGWKCVPARSFLLNEIATMLPRALSGKRWYIEKFGEEKVANRKAIIPGLL
jgi:3-oxo-5-alpha-steroid 4-dehydrogenase 1